MGVCLPHPSIAAASNVASPVSSPRPTRVALPLPVFKPTPPETSMDVMPSLNSDAPFAGYDCHVWSDLQRQKKHADQDASNTAMRAPRSSSIAILQRISLQRLSMSADKISLLDDLRPKNKEEEGGAALSGFSIGGRARRLSSALNDVYAHLNDVTPRHEDEAKTDYLKRVFAIVDTGGQGRVSSKQLANSLFSDAHRASTAVMMAAADHDKDGFLSESDFVSFFIHVESGDDCLQADRNDVRPMKSNSSSESDGITFDAFAGLSAQQAAQRSPHRFTSPSDVRMRGVTVTNLASQSNRIKCIALSPDGKLYAVAHRHDNVAHVHIMDSGAEVRRLVGHQGSLLGIIFSPDRKHIMTAARDNFMVSWDRTVGLECSFAEHPGIVTAIAVSWDGKFVFSGCQDNLVRKITASKAKIRAVLPEIQCESPGVIVALATQSTKGDLLAFSRSCDQCAYVANAHTLQLVAQLSGHESLVWQASFNADDTLLLTCCEKKIIVWNGATFASIGVYNSATVATPMPSNTDEVLWTTAVFASLEHRRLLFCFNSVGQMHVLNCDGTGKETSIMDVQLRSSVYTASIFAGNTMVCGDDFGNVYRVSIT
ncbi:WD domain, G-beta repeat [Novymonas esmeraldas]|uniref:WD domain, G-beta repeat n=1 Tax=Novymonas esmeraldas TaxID=1808958 RepID=A0AAW0EK29_9TRYP